MVQEKSVDMSEMHWGSEELASHEYVFCGEGTEKNGQRTVRVKSAYCDYLEEYTFGEFKHCFTGIHVMPSL